jgi:hypothetical protein
VSETIETPPLGPPPWEPPPASATWTLTQPLTLGTTKFTAITMRAPTVGEVMAVTSVRGMSNLETTLRLIEKVSAEQVPYDALVNVPAWIIDQIGRYMEAFTAAPMPYPLPPASASAAPAAS